MAKLFYTIEKLGPKRSLTPEGYLLCEDVPIARTGEMEYGASELINDDGSYAINPLPGKDIIIVQRSAEQVFRPATIASGNGKSITNDHPESGEVNPLTWKELTGGIVQNVRRGVGHQDDLMLADLLITTPDEIEAVQSGKREVSCGYTADYVDHSDGTGHQENIIINHVALVERGRCGWRCAIGDHQPNKETVMSTKRNWLTRVLDAVKNKDEGELNTILKETPDEVGGEGGEGETHVHIHAAGGEGGATTGDEDFVPRSEFEEHKAKNAEDHQRFTDSIEALKAHTNLPETGGADDPDEVGDALEAEAPKGTGDKARKAKDSIYLAESFKESASIGEILAPGIRIPSYDKAAAPSQTYKKLCHFRRQALDLAYASPEGRSIIEDALGGRTLDTTRMSCDSVRTLFHSAGAMMRKQNNDAGRGAGAIANAAAASAKGGKNPPQTIKSVKDLTRIYKEQHKQT